MNACTKMVRVIEKAEFEISNRFFIVLLLLINTAKVVIGLDIGLRALSCF